MRDGQSAPSLQSGVAGAGAALARYSLQNDIQTLVTVTTVGVEKMMIRAGLDVSRFGPHLKIGIERAVALRIELNAKTQIALYGGVLVEQRLAVS